MSKKQTWIRAEKRDAYVVGQWSLTAPKRHDPSQPYSVIVAEVAQFRDNFVVYSDHVGTVATGDLEDIAFEHEEDAVRRAIQLNRDFARRLDAAADAGEKRLDEIANEETGYPEIKVGDRVMLLGTVRDCATIYHDPKHTYTIGRNQERGRPGSIGTVVEISTSGFDHAYLVEYDSLLHPLERAREWCTRMELTHAAPGEKSPSEITMKADEIRG